MAVRRTSSAARSRSPPCRCTRTPRPRLPASVVRCSVGAQDALVGNDPQQFFVPPYVGHRGWLGVRLDRGIEEAELAELCEEAYRHVAPVTLVRQADAAG